jgi:hypothetical protein
VNTQREYDALNAYLKLLQNKGYSEAKLIQRQYLIQRLIPLIVELPQDGNSYRGAVDQLFNTLDQAEWAICIPVIRDYYSFWIKDIKAIAGMNQDKAFEADANAWKPDTSNLAELWASLDKVILTHVETQPLQTYESALRRRGADDCFINMCTKLVKFLLLGLRQAQHKQPNAYRKIIDANLSLFSNDESYHAYLNVGREFYYFWRGDGNGMLQIAMAA